MRLITDNELSRRSDVELAVLFQKVSEGLAGTKPGTPARRTVIASLQNISRARAQRQRRYTVPGF
ncbi:MAG: hypothetical protein RIM84_18655 [Alphaproteobacteria bacterium]